MHRGIRAILFFILLLCLSCNPSKDTEHSFYYWKTSFDETTDNAIKQFGADHFYIRYFDVDWSSRYGIPVPQADIAISQNAVNYLGKEITPVVFITNRSFEHVSISYCDTLAMQVSERIKQTSQHLQAYTTGKQENSIKELQLDCDWTAGTKEKYFTFLQKIKQLNPDKQISVTIRLYPYKYRQQMGIPPVDKGILMCYNLGHIQSGYTNNSIFDLKVLKQYLRSQPYPLPLDVALPVFGWYVWFRGDRYMGILYSKEQGVTEISHTNDGNHYIISADVVYQDKYLREGDILRAEYPNERELLSGIQLLSSNIKYRRIAFYYWDKDLISRYEHTIKDIFSKY